MSGGPPRSVLVVLCGFAVVLGATLFPSTGFGANPVPAQQGGNATPVDGEGPPQSGMDANGTTTGSETKTGTTQTQTASPTRTSDSKTTTPATATAQEPTTTATTTSAASGTETDDDGGAMGAVLSALTAIGIGLIGVLGTAVGLGRHHRRRNPQDWDLPEAPHLRVLAYVRRIPQTSLSFVLFAGKTTPAILRWFRGGLGTSATGLGALAEGAGHLVRATSTALVALPAGFVRGIGGLARGLGSISFGLSALFSGLDGLSIPTRGGGSRPGDDPRGGRSEEPAAAEPPTPSPPASVTEAWARLQEDLGVGGADGLTPSQIARRAVDRGVPREAIESLTRAFQEVRYGGRPDDGDRVGVARSAYERIRTALEGESS